MAAFELALGLHRRGAVAEAEAAYRSCLGTEPSAAAYNNLAALQWSRRAHDEAQASWRAAISLAPRETDAHSNLAAALKQLGHTRSAWHVLTAAVALVPASSGLYARMGALLTAGRPLSVLSKRALRVALAVARTAVRLSPTEGPLWHNLALAMVAQGGPNATARAGRAYRRALALDPLSADNHVGLASTQPRDEATMTLRQAIGIASGGTMHGPTAALYYNLGNLLQLGRYDAWRAHASAALDAVPVDSSSVLAAGGEDAGRHGGGRATLVQGAARSSLLSALSEAPQLAAIEATRLFEVAARLRPTHADAHYNAALAPQQAHIDLPWSHPITAYGHALRLAPTDAKIWSRLVTTLDWAGKTSEAAHLCDAAVRAGVWQDARQRPAMLVPGLAASPWHESVAYEPLLRTLRGAHELLLDALDAVVSSGAMLPQPEGLQEAGQEWQVFDVGEACAAASTAASAAASTVAITAARAAAAGADPAGGTVGATRGGRVRDHLTPACRVLDELRTSGASASPPHVPLRVQFSRMAGGVHVRPHTGPTNAKLTLHYGLVVPSDCGGDQGGAGESRGGEGSGIGAEVRLGSGAHGGGDSGDGDGDGHACRATSRIRVGEETRPFVSRGLLAFDDSFEHEVWNGAKTARTTLVLHVAHPDLAGDIQSVVEATGALARVGG